MANSDSIIEWKNRILTDLQFDDEFVSALGVTESERNRLIWSRLFPHFYNPELIKKVSTYVMLTIDIETRSSYFTADMYTFPKITFYIVTHQDDMNPGLAGVSATRMDYLSKLITDKYNGAEGFGVSKLKLDYNGEDNLSEIYRMRKIVFKGADLNENLCG